MLRLSYQVGDWVYVKFHPYRQTSLTHAKYNKLYKRYYSPFQISKQIGVIAYRLALPVGTRIHDVFHCSLLKLHQVLVVQLTNPLLPSAIDNHPLIKPFSILDSKWSTDISRPTLLVLVQWSGLVPKDTTWEKWDDLRKIFHLEDTMSLQWRVLIEHATNFELGGHYRSPYTCRTTQKTRRIRQKLLVVLVMVCQKSCIILVLIQHVHFHNGRFQAQLVAF